MARNECTFTERPLLLIATKHWPPTTVEIIVNPIMLAMFKMIGTMLR